jgi:hypothetical protein
MQMRKSIVRSTIALLTWRLIRYSRPLCTPSIIYSCIYTYTDIKAVCLVFTEIYRFIAQTATVAIIGNIRLGTIYPNLFVLGCTCVPNLALLPHSAVFPLGHSWRLWVGTDSLEKQTLDLIAGTCI